jgi:hypothetical protein
VRAKAPEERLALLDDPGGGAPSAAEAGDRQGHQRHRIHRHLRGLDPGRHLGVLAIVGSNTGNTQIENVGAGVAIGILMDTILVRTLLVPSTVVAAALSENEGAAARSFDHRLLGGFTSPAS